MCLQVPTIVGGQSCESCNNAYEALGPPDSYVSEEKFDHALERYGLSGQNGSSVSTAMLKGWYADRLASEGRWRTFARILSDSGHACSSTLHAEALGSTGVEVYRYFFDYVTNGLPGATHGGDEGWLFQTKGSTCLLYTSPSPRDS